MFNEKNTPFLSIIIPVYNVDKYLNKCLDSIVKQSFRDYELICIDDGSVDNSLSILESYAKNDDRIVLIKKENGGLSSARNAGLNIAKGKWVLFIDSDDVLGINGRPTLTELEKLCNQVSGDVDWAVAKSTVFYESGCEFKDLDGDKSYFQLPKAKIYNSLSIRSIHMNVCAWGKIYKREFIENFKLRFPEGLIFEDEYWYSCCLLVSNKIQVLDLYLYSYLRRNGGIIGKSLKKRDISVSKDILNIIDEIIKWFKKNELNNEDKSFLIKRIYKLYRSSINACQLEDRTYVYWRMGKILRDNNVDCSENNILQTLKLGGIEPKKTKLSKLRNSIVKRVVRFKSWFI